MRRRAGLSGKRDRPEPSTTAGDEAFMALAVEVALRAERAGNLPIGCVIVRRDRVVAAAGNAIRSPSVAPGAHAEIRALSVVAQRWLRRARELTCYTTLEPCLMCYGSLILHGVARVVFGSTDTLGGATMIQEHLPPWVRRQRDRIRWCGPAFATMCDPLRDRALRLAVEPPGASGVPERQESDIQRTS